MAKKLNSEEKAMLDSWKRLVSNMSNSELVQAYCETRGYFRAVVTRQMKKENI